MFYNLMLEALATAYERIVAWADILDRINVYPVPDGDTGRNLVITLSTLRNSSGSPEVLTRKILLSARGNSGNIAARFLAGLVSCPGLESLSLSAEAGRDMAYRAVSDPQPGTMLSLYDALVISLKKNPPEGSGTWVRTVLNDLEEAVKTTREQLPELKKAGVVDAGALGMLVFLDPLLGTLAGLTLAPSLFSEDLSGALTLSADWVERPYQGYCLDVVLKVEGDGEEARNPRLEAAESLITLPEGDYLKLHFHALDREGARENLATMGAIVSWSEDDLAEQTRRFYQPGKNQRIHIMTDAAGSVNRPLAQSLGITLLNSYITMGQLCLPETFVDPSQLFAAMRGGTKVSTSQASNAERSECYHTVMQFYDRVLYLCVGSFYTGNYQAAMKWKDEHDPEDRMTVIDTGVASGKLALIAKAAAESALAGNDPSEVIARARKAVEKVQEYIFLDKLHFLAAGGRMSKTGAFLGDVLRIKPIVSPFPDGARKVGVVRTVQDQMKFAFRCLDQELPREVESPLLLEYSDNREWIEREIKPALARRFPLAKITLQLLSLTSAAHMGPGSWGMAFFPRNLQQDDSNG